jgi:hypothetical protein
MNTQFLTKPVAKLAAVTSRKHVSVPIGIAICGGVFAHIGSVWFPAHTAQFKETADSLEKAAMMYATMAASQMPQQPQPPTEPPTT